ncbi:hypothetical protein K505DRAFT_360282 [Melanomma pulvis-pyrius CBS 109.77]|uniref:Uncharacterized protein n=1 Tax=Melanomma pulvis-pyrius CBS 109.77 TaxID=1314802 RepID=A0A6A6XG72_9PLEO|nr:hypothetical protein K505DRAFT_360282 [Melanomma pulvis-pyrius CBS 109.77]
MRISTPRQIAAFLAASRSLLVHAVPYDGPLATPVMQRFAENGWTPKPTGQPLPLLELFRRQEDPAFCGYLEGDGELAVTCGRGSSCMYAERFSWFGCCTGTSITDCNVITACVQSASLDECLSSSECYDDPLAMACTSRAAPFCLQLYTVVTGATYGHFECAATSTILEVLPTTTDPSNPNPSLGFSLSLPLETTDGPISTSTRSRSSRHVFASTNDDATETESLVPSATESEGEIVTTSEIQFSFSLNTPRTTEPQSSETGTGTAAGVSSTTTGAAQRTAEAVMGAVGGVAGLVALFV